MGRREGSHSAVADRYGLTGRQHEVLALMAQGQTNYEIAQELGLTLEGAKYHVSEILGKFGVESREEAVAIANRRGWRWPSLRRLRVVAAVAALAGTGVVVAALLLAPGGVSKPDGPPHVWAALLHGPAGSPQAGVLEVADATAGTRRQIGSPGLTYGAAIWSPDGSRLFSVAVTGGDADSISMRIFRADGDWAETVLDEAAAFSSPGWSADGKFLALVGDRVQMFDRDGKLLFDKALVEDGTRVSVTNPFWAPDSRRLAVATNGKAFLVGVGGKISPLQPPAELGVQAVVPLYWQDADTLIVYDDLPADPPLTFAVNTNSNHWSRVASNVPDHVVEFNDTAVAVQSAAHSETLQELGPTADGRGIVFDTLRPDSTSGATVPVALTVYFDGVTTRIPLASDVLPLASARGGVVIAPAR